MTVRIVDREENKLKESELDIVKAFISPVALIDKLHTHKDNKNNVNKKFNNEEEYPFRRYINSGVKIVTHDGYN